MDKKKKKKPKKQKQNSKRIDKAERTNKESRRERSERRRNRFEHRQRAGRSAVNDALQSNGTQKWTNKCNEDAFNVVQRRTDGRPTDAPTRRAHARARLKQRPIARKPCN